MTTLVTGASGFLGQAIVQKLVDNDRSVLAMHRPTSSLGALEQLEGVTAVAGDLRQRGEWAEALRQATSLVHCAAAAEGDLATQLAGTVLATENLLAHLPQGLERFVHISSFSVYDFNNPSRSGKLDEQTNVESAPSRRDAYTQTKILQEELVRRHCDTHGIPLVVLRPGAIYGPGKAWDYGRALRVGPFDLVFAPGARMRLVHVADCAEAVQAALEVAVDDTLIVNVVGDEQPSHWAYRQASRKAGADLGIGIPVPYAMVGLLGWSARLASKTFFKGRARLPELLDRPRQAARWRPLRYANDRAQARLNWREGKSLENALPEIVARDAENRESKD